MSEQQSLALYAIDLLGSLTKAEIEELGRSCTFFTLAKGASALERNNQGSDLFLVLKGIAAAKGYSVEGKEVHFGNFAAGQIFGEFSAIDGQPRSATIEAVEDCMFATMPSGTFRNLIATHPEVGLKIAELLVSKIRVLTRRVFEYSTMPVNERLYAELVRLLDESIERDAGIIRPAPSHYEIATRLSTHREAVSKELAVLVKKGIVETGRKMIRVLDVERLRALAHYDSEPS